MSKVDFEHGSSTVADFFHFMRERHSIWHKRFVMLLPKPWTNDQIFQQWKFTNVFRQLDRGTIALHNALRHETNIRNIITTIGWYRLFNWYKHIEHLGVCSYPELEEYIIDIDRKDGRVFTSAHMTTGVSGEAKAFTYLRASKMFFDFADEIEKACETDSMEQVFKELLHFYMVGKFVAYEMVCDLRFTRALHPTDILSWANIGPGAKRGLERLGLKVDLESMQGLWMLFTAQEKQKKEESLFYKHIARSEYPPFELREIEHSLCEFDKYERIRLGQGTPRQKYKGI
jgi:hypothetical protein